VKKSFSILGLSLLLVFSTLGETKSESSQILLTGASGSNVDIDGNEQFDALTDGLLVWVTDSTLTIMAISMR
jgi:hypothetical protein